MGAAPAPDVWPQIKLAHPNANREYWDYLQNNPNRDYFDSRSYSANPIIGDWGGMRYESIESIEQYIKDITGGSLPSNAQRRGILANYEKAQGEDAKARIAGEYAERLGNWLLGYEFIGEPNRLTDAQYEEKMKGMWMIQGLSKEEADARFPMWWENNKDKLGHNPKYKGPAESHVAAAYQIYRDQEGGKVASPSGGVKRRGPGGGTKSSPSGINPGGYNATTSGLGPRRRLVSLD